MNPALSVTIIGISFSLSYVLFISSQSFISGQAQNSTTIVQINNESQYYIPPTISKGAQEILKNLIMNLPAFAFVTLNPDDLKGWQEQNQQILPMFSQMSQPIVDSYQHNITYTRLGGVNVLDIKPNDWRDNGKVLIYLHGGSYTFLDANSTLGNVVPVANSTGLRVISVDYSLAPFSKWDQTTDEVISVVKALRDQGYSLDDIGMFGDSAGGGLVAGSVLKMRDEGVGMPSVLVLWSPRTDVTGIGDTFYTLRNADPFLNVELEKNRADAYANPSDQRNPYVSPVYGNFTTGFPPTLIQGGTKEIFLSDFVRLYQVLEQANIPVKLDIYEGMPHVFQFFLYNSTESDLALSKTNDFFKEYLNY
jgi:epsilon-lactone hydrolase